MGAHMEHFKGKIRVKVNSSSKRLLDLPVIPDGKIASAPQSGICGRVSSSQPYKNWKRQSHLL